MVVSLRHPEPIDGLSFKIEFHQHRGLISHHPPVVPWFDGNDLGSCELERAAVGVLNMDFAAGQETYVGVHTELGGGNRFHITGPAKAGRVNYTLDPARAGPDYVEFETANVAVFALIQRREKRISDIHYILRGALCARVPGPCRILSGRKDVGTITQAG